MQTKTFSIRNSLGFAWKHVTSHIGMFIGISLLMFIASMIFRSVAGGFHRSHMEFPYTLMTLVSWLINLYFVYRLITIGNKLYLGQSVRFSDLYEGGSARTYLNYVASTLLKMIFLLPIVIIGVVLGLATSMFGVSSHNVPLFILIGAVLGIICIIYSLMTFFTSASAVVGGKGPWDSLVESIRLSSGVRGKIFFFMLACVGIAIIACIPLGLGLLIVIPMIPIAGVHAYHTLKGDHEVAGAQVQTHA